MLVHTRGSAYTYLVDGTEANELTLQRGKTYRFFIAIEKKWCDLGLHFYITREPAGGGEGLVTSGVENQVSQFFLIP